MKNELFEIACKNALKLQNISDENKLILYGLYKQSTIGDCNTKKPLWFKRQVMWESWMGYEGIKPEIAKQMYIDKVNELL